MQYDRLKHQAAGIANKAGEQRKAAQTAGLGRYLAVPQCGGGYADHYRSSISGRCLSCGELRAQRKQQQPTKADSAGKHESLEAVEARRASLAAATGQTLKQARKQRRRQLVAARKLLQQHQTNEVSSKYE